MPGVILVVGCVLACRFGSNGEGAAAYVATIQGKANDGVLEVGRERSVEILTEVVLKNMNLVSSRVKRFTDVDSSSGEGDKVENVSHSGWKVLECVGRNDHPTVAWDGEP